MKIVKASYSIEAIMPEDVMAHLERCGRTCYRSEGKIDDGRELRPGPSIGGPTPEQMLEPWIQVREPSSHKLLRAIITHGHESVIEHASATVRFVVDRGVSHELVRHRLCAFSQESTRYVRYDGEEDGHEIVFIQPCYWRPESPEWNAWDTGMWKAEEAYLRLLGLGAKPEEARSVLPNSLRTTIVVTANLREWRHILRLRTSTKAHPQMREVMVPLLAEFKKRLPVLFEDIEVAR